MGKLIKILAVVVIVVTVIVAGLSVFVRFYLTDERVRAMAIPQAEKVLGRTVEIGRIEVGLFKGITVKDFSVKEADGLSDFLSTKEFVLRYDLIPLLRRRIVVSELRLVAPQVQVMRDESGHFNFDTLAFIAGAETEVHERKKEEKEEKPAQVALPFALTVDHVRVDEAHFILRDAMGELPEADMTADLSVELDMGRDPSSIKYKGDLRFSGDAIYGDIRPHISGKSGFDQEKAGCTIDVNIEDQRINVEADARNYLGAPQIKMDIKSEKLDLDRLLALAEGLPEASRTPAEKSGKARAPVASAAAAAALPPGLQANGLISVREALYKGLQVKDFNLKYSLKDGIFKVEDLNARAADGKMESVFQADLTRPEIVFDGRAQVDSLKIQTLLTSLVPGAGDTLSGVFGADFEFSGKGVRWPTLRDTLTVQGTYAATDGKIKNTPISRAVAKLLGLDELNNLSFKRFDGSVKLFKGKVTLKSRMSGKNIGMNAAGRVGLDGSLDLPVTLSLSRELSDKLQKRASVAKYLVTEKGETTLHIKLGGTLSSPRPGFDTSVIRKQVEEKVRRKATKEIERIFSGDKDKKEGEESSKPGAAKELIKGILGR